MNTTIIFPDGSEIDSTDLSASRQLMVDDGFPAAALFSPQARLDAWIGRKLKPTATFGTPAPKQEIDPGTAKLLAEQAAAAKAAAAKKKADRREAAIIKAKQKINPAAAAATEETDMSKTNAKTTPKADQVKGLRERRAEARDRLQGALGRPLTGKKHPKAPAKAASKKAATAKSRTPAAAKPAGGAAKGVRAGSKLEIVVGLLTRKEGCTSAEVLKATDWPAVSMPQQARAAGLTLRQEKDGKVTRYWAS